MKLILIHGRSQEGKDPVVLQKTWEKTLSKGLSKAGLTLPDNIEIVLPFYGDKLDELENQLDTPLIEDVLFRGAYQDSSEASFRSELLYELAQNAGISDADIQKHYNGKPQEKGPLNWEWVHSILKALDNTSLGDMALDTFTRDVYVYLTNRSVRKIIDGIISPHISDSPCVVVGHSLGSVVGYNVLRSIPQNINVKQYITVGSPLGLKAIKKQLDTPLSMPSCVDGWYNAMDERDVVALHPLDDHNFPIKPSIRNKTSVDNQTKNRHGIIGYLNDPDVAKNIHINLIS